MPQPSIIEIIWKIKYLKFHFKFPRGQWVNGMALNRWQIIHYLNRWWSSCMMPLGFSELNSLAPGRFEWNFRYVILKQILVIDGWGISCEIALIWMSLDIIDDQSTLVQVMVWCRQATSQYWPRSLSPYGVTRPQWVKYQMLSSESKYTGQQLRCDEFWVMTI